MPENSPAPAPSPCQHMNTNYYTDKRTIKETIEKVSSWRKLIVDGVVVLNNISGEEELKKFSEEEASERVKVSLFDLEYYRELIQCGIKFGFEFKQNIDEEVSKLAVF